MLTVTERARLDDIIARDPFAAALPDFVETLRSDDLVAVLFLHERTGGNCRCANLRLGESHAVHVAQMIRDALPDRA
jgi:hypothetical protein